MEAPTFGGGMSVPPSLTQVPVWVVSPHRLVAQAVVAALGPTGARVQFHAWEDVHDDLRTGVGGKGVRHLLAIFEGVEPRGAADAIRRFVSVGDVRVAIVTSPPEAAWWGGLLQSPAVDVVTVSTSLDQLADVVDRFVRDVPLMNQEDRDALVWAWAEALDKRRHLVGRVDALSHQQRKVLELLASGRRVHEVAELMGLADGTVRSHVKSLRAKLGARTQLEAVAMLQQVEELSRATDLVPRPRSPSDHAEGSAHSRR